MNTRLRAPAAALFLLVCGSAGYAEGPYVADPDPDGHPTMHLQPPALPAALRARRPYAPASMVNGITYLDVLLASGFDIAGEDRGNETSIAYNPRNPSQIVISSFAGTNWSSGGNSALFISGDAGASWSYQLVVPPPPGAASLGCPCDQTFDWGRNGLLYGTFLDFAGSPAVATVYSAESPDPANPGAWVYRLSSGNAQPTNLPAFLNVDQPWLFSGPAPGDNGVTHVCVAYDNFDAPYNNSQIRAADSPGASPLDFTRDASTNVDGMAFNDGMNPGNRIAVGSDGTIFNVFQRLQTIEANGVKKVTYLITVSTDGGQTWSVANSDHASGAKIIATDVYSFQGNGSKIGGVNALLGGVTAIAADPKTGTAWVVYGGRTTISGTDQLFMVPVTYSAGSLNVGTVRTLTTATVNNYLPSVAVLASGEVGVLFVTLSGSNFAWRFVQWNNGATLSKTTLFPSFTSPFPGDPNTSNQRIFGDYVQIRSAGCAYYGAFPMRGAGVNSVNSIVPYFMSAPNIAPCSAPALSAINPSVTCAGGPDLSLAVQGTGYNNGATGRIGGSLRTTSFVNAFRVNTTLSASDLATPGVFSVDLLNAAPAGGLTGALPLTVEAAPASPGGSLLASASSPNVSLTWAPSAAATSYRVRRCDATAGPCTPAPVATPAGNSYQDAVLADGLSYWYAIDAVNSCGPIP